MIKESYNSFKKRFSLPDYDKLNFEFEISEIECEEFLLREIRKKIVDKIHFYIDSIKHLVQPDSVISDVQEAENFTEEEMDRVFKLYKQLKILDRRALEVTASNTDEENAAFISYVFKIWPEIKKQIKFVAKKMQDSWSKEIVSKEDVSSYLR